jgi:hypothetical protein
MFFEPASLEDTLARLASLPRSDTGALLLLIAEREAPDLEALVEGLRARGVRFLGGLFPAVTDGRRKHEAGLVAVPIPMLGEPCVVRELSQSPQLPPGPGEALDAHGSGGRPTGLILVDGLSPGIEPFLRNVYDQLGNGVSYLGGGAGSLSLQQRPCLLTSEGVFSDAAVLALSPWGCGLGVRHGWRPIAGPLVATRTRRNRVEQLNWEPAFPVYQGLVAADSGCVLEPERFGELAREFPFGLFREDQESVVRDPIQADETGALVCVGSVPENSVLHIMRGEPERLIAAAAAAARDATRALSGTPKCSLLIDCISRALFLGRRYDEELAAVSAALAAGGAPAPVGALTLGEVSCRGDGYLEFFNKTAVVGVLHDD